MTLVKICGLRDISDMLIAAEYGADLLGLVFVPGVRRTLNKDYARDLLINFRFSRGEAAVQPPIVGLFANQPADEVNRIAQHVGLDKVQLCGDEDMEYCRQIDYPILKTLHVPEMFSKTTSQQEEILSQLDHDLSNLEQSGYLPLLDKFSETQPGGLGETFDWGIAQQLSSKGKRFLLAGGLNQTNVRNAINVVRPYGVDVSSGVETAGLKDPKKIQSFLSETKESEVS